jgi:hypothetical protein
VSVVIKVNPCFPYTVEDCEYPQLKKGGYTGGFNAVITILARTQPAPAAKMIPFLRAFNDPAATTDEMTATVKST